MEEKKRPWWHYVLAFGCISVLIAGIMGALGAWKLYSLASESFMSDPVRVDKLAGEIFPGAKPFAGHDGTLGMDALGIRMAMISPPLKSQDTKGKLLIFLMDYKDKVATSEEARGAMVSKQGGSSGKTDQERVISTDIVKLNLGSQPFDAQKVLVEDSRHAKLLRYMLAFRKGQGSAFLMVQGGPDDFDQKDMDSFLAGLDPTGLVAIPLSPAEGTKTPGGSIKNHAALKTPAATQTPVATETPADEETPTDDGETKTPSAE